MNICKMIVYSGNNINPSYISKYTGAYKEIKSNEISKNIVNVTIQLADILIIDDLLSFPYELFISNSIKPIVIVNLDEKNLPEANTLYAEFLLKFISPYDFIISNSNIIKDSSLLSELIQASSATLIAKDDVVNFIKIILSKESTEPEQSHYLQYNNLSLMKNKLAYLQHESVFLNLQKQILLPNLRQNTSVIEFSSRNEPTYKKHFFKEKWQVNYFRITENKLPNLSTASLDEKNNVGILAFEYHNNSDQTYRNLIENIVKQLISGAYFILLEDLLPPNEHREGLSILDWQEMIVEASHSQLAFEHFELFQYKGICDEITSACYVLRKLGNN